VEEKTAQALLDLNRKFYSSFAHAFSSSRTANDPLLLSILPCIPPAATVLDVGCGNGRLALLLDRERPASEYVGLDSVPELIELARSNTDRLERVTATFETVDVSEPGWTRVLGGAMFDCIAALAVIHHIPGSDGRARLVRQMVDALAPAGSVILSTWQFLDSSRQRRKIVSWRRVNIAESELDAGDYLIEWRRGGRGLRYCHLVDEAEVCRLAAACGLRVARTFRAGGREGNLSLVACLTRPVVT
jgi:SAM-dependent methyltransferase